MVNFFMGSKRDQIISATCDLIVEEGLLAVSMAQIAQRAEVGMGTIYNYLPSKEEMVCSLYHDIKSAMSSYVLMGYDESQPVVTRFLHMLSSIVYYGREHPREFRLAQQLAQVAFIQGQANPQLCHGNGHAASVCRGSGAAPAQGPAP